MLEEISIDQQDRWDAELQSIGTNDTYFSHNYHLATSEQNEAPVLLSCSAGKDHFVIPFVVRPVQGTDCFDVTSAYGYLGPLSRRPNPSLDSISQFNRSLEDWFCSNNCVTAFSRLHPLFDQNLLMSNIGEILEIGTTVSIDLSVDEQSQKSRYRKGTKSDISRLKKFGARVYESSYEQGIATFVEIYEENMSRIGAGKSYFFSRAYYAQLFEPSPIYEAKLFMAELDGKVVAAAIFLVTENCVQYHLSGTRDGDFPGSISRLIIDFVRSVFTESSQKCLHLGGGIGSQEDSLFKFKSGFSKRRHAFSIWQHIVDHARYDQLVEQTGGSDSSYFPAYRSPTG